MTGTRTCEFDHNNNPKKTEEIKDGFSGLLCSEVEDGLSGLPYFGGKDDKGGILEDGFVEKVKKKRRICETGRLSDPLVVLGSDIMLMILSCLDARSVALCLLVSCGWKAVASVDKIWSSKCEELWQGKTHLPRIAKVNGLSKLAVYSLSVMDGKRKRIRKEDLYDHAWEFHFTEALSTYRNHAWLQLAPNRVGRVCTCLRTLKSVRLKFKCTKFFEGLVTLRSFACVCFIELLPAKLITVCLVLYPAAPEYWRMLDPYWNGTGRPLRRYFLPDGSQTAEPDDRIWGGHESCYSIVTSLLADGKIRQHYVRINRWPPMYVTRKEDWSWGISNDLCTYRSIPDADKEDGTGPLFLLH